MSLVQEGPLAFADDLSLTPGMTSVEQPDATTYKYTIRDGVTYTLAALEKALADAPREKAGQRPHKDVAAENLVTMALAYLDFAAGNAARWRALFAHRLPVGKNLPDWYLADQVKLFGYVERPLRALKPTLKPAEGALLARSLFSAVHGLVTLGLEEKLGVVPLATLRKQVALFVAATGRGLAD